jgi:hypothetical protein
VVYLPKAYKNLYSAEKKNKYGAVKITVDGIKFDSKKEAARYQSLKLAERCGAISDLETQPRFDIRVNGKYIAFYKADFRYMKNGSEVVEDVKSAITAKNPVYRLKKKLVEAIHNVKINEM